MRANEARRLSERSFLEESVIFEKVMSLITDAATDGKYSVNVDKITFNAIAWEKEVETVIRLIIALGYTVLVLNDVGGICDDNREAETIMINW